MNLTISISTLGKSPRFEYLLNSLNLQTDKNFTVGFCDQSDTGDLGEYLNKRELSFSFYVCKTGKKGLSRGRNEIIRAAPPGSTHFVFPNDTSTFNKDFVSEVRRQAENTQLTVLSYLENGYPRYRFPKGIGELNRDNVWLVLEGAVVLSRDILEASKGFDELLGAGSEGPFQSGEGTDLLLRVMPLITKIRWAPDIQINGVSQNFNLRRRDQRLKAFHYGMGYGHLLNKHGYSRTKKLKSLLGPIFRSFFALNNSRKPFLEAIYSSAGRLCGMLYRDS